MAQIREQLIFPIIREICQEEGIGFWEEPSRGVYGVLKFKDGNYIIKDVNLNVNSGGSAGLARNKAATSEFLQEFGYRVPEFTMVYSDEFCTSHRLSDTLEKGVAYAKAIGYPVVAKKNDSSKGRGIYKVLNEQGLRRAASEIFQDDHRFQIQKYYDTRDYRVVVLNGEVIQAYQRVPLMVTGDGRSTMRQLLEERQKRFIDTGRDTILEINDDEDLARHISEAGLSFDSVVDAGRIVRLRDVSNLSAGGDCVDKTAEIHEKYKELCIRITHDLGMKLCGVDIMCPDIEQEPHDDYVILEVNSSPGLDNYAFEGEKQVKYVKELYRKVVLFIGEHLVR